MDGCAARKCPLPRSSSELVDRRRDPLILSQYHARLMGYLYLANPEDEIFSLLPRVGFNVQFDRTRLILFVLHRHKASGHSRRHLVLDLPYQGCIILHKALETCV